MTLAKIAPHIIAQIVCLVVAYGATAFVMADLNYAAWGEDARFVTVLLWAWMAGCAPMAVSAILRAMEGRE